MSMTERIKDLMRAQGNLDLLGQLQADEKKAKQIALEQAQGAGEDAAMAKQRSLLEALRERGVLSLIEQATGLKGIGTPTFLPNNSPWGLSYKTSLKEDGKWNTDLDLEIERTLDVGANRGRQCLVRVSLTPTGQLEIKGKELTYTGFLVHSSPHISEQIEGGLIRAFADPLIY